MSRTYPGNGHGKIDTDGIWQAVEQFKARFEKSAGSRVGRGDVRAAVLALLAEKPMHGYQIINEIEQRSGGEWKPSAGSVYPTLQLLSDEGLISAEESNGRKTYSLTDSGRAVAGDGPAAPWSTTEEKGAGFADLPKAGVELAQAAAQVQRTGSQEQIRDAIGVLEDARKRLYAILARD